MMQVKKGHNNPVSEVVRDTLQAALQEGEDSGDAGSMDAAMIKAQVLQEMGRIE